MSLRTFSNKTRQLLSDHAPVILTGAAIVGTAVTGVLAGRAGFKAGWKVGSADALNLAADKIEDEPPRDRRLRLAKETWPMYIMPVVTGGSTIAAIAMANRINTNRLAGLAAAYAIADKAHTEYQDKVAEVIGEKKENTIHDKVVQDRVNAGEVGRTQTIIVGEGDGLWYDVFSDRYFTSNMEAMKKAQNDTNYELNKTLYVSLADFYERIGLTPTKYSKEIGWSTDEQVELHFTAIIVPDGRAAMAFTFHVEPARSNYKAGGI